MTAFAQCQSCHVMRPLDDLVRVDIGANWGVTMVCVSPVVCRLTAQMSGLWGSTLPAPWRRVSPG